MPAPASGSQGQLQVQITVLSERLEKGFDEIKSLLRSYEERVRGMEQKSAACQPIVMEQLKQTKEELEDHDARIIAAEKAVATLMTAYKIQVFLGSALILSILALIWSLITGQAEVSFR